MGKPPAVVIVARHGARLDAADKQWHLTSPSPYDPPLTYGGWTQGRALGARIAALLHAREVAHDSDAASSQSASTKSNAEGTKPERPAAPAHRPSARPKRKKHRIIIHSSPFLRCLQTSIAIGAGISQYQGVLRDEHEQAKTARRQTFTGTVTPQLLAERAIRSSRPSAVAEDHTVDEEASASPKSPAKLTHRTRLRVDAFLGEWLTPDYFEAITPPPDSVLMVAGAKAELLHRGEPLDPAEDPLKPPPNRGSFPGGWLDMNRKGAHEDKKSPNSALPSGTTAEEHLSRLSLRPNRDRASTQDSSGVTASRPARLAQSMTGKTSSGYNPPIPRYALAPNDPIPPGYVTHAREACVDVDYQWDTLHAPQDWGHGGEYGEEWSAMHRRFRTGLQKMIAWYRLHHESSHQKGGHQRRLHPASIDDEDDENTDTVLVLVTHGAGSNALIGALTNQPVLMDVGLASLTMAVRREESTSAPSSPPLAAATPRMPHSPAARELILSREYSVLLTASTDHLRSHSNPLVVPVIPYLPPASSTRSNRAGSVQHIVPTISDIPPHSAAAPSARHPVHTQTGHYRPLPSASSLITQSPLDQAPPVSIVSPLGSPRGPGEGPPSPFPRFSVANGLSSSSTTTSPKSPAFASTGLWSKPLSPAGDGRGFNTLAPGLNNLSSSRLNLAGDSSSTGSGPHISPRSHVSPSSAPISPGEHTILATQGRGANQDSSDSDSDSPRFPDAIASRGSSRNATPGISGPSSENPRGSEDDILPSLKLWGTPAMPVDDRQARNKGFKRRWTSSAGDA